MAPDKNFHKSFVTRPHHCFVRKYIYIWSWWGGHMFVGDLVAKWPHLFVIKFVYWWWNVCILCITCS